MFQLLFISIIFAFAASAYEDVASHQLQNFKTKVGAPIGILTTNQGCPVEERDTISSLNTNLISNEWLMESMSHVVRERTIERSVHTQGTGAFGYFEVTHNISNICSADLFNKIGKKTPVVVRFSQTFSNKGAFECSREARGFAVKFCTQQGQFDMVGFNTDTYAYKDPLLFSALVHALRRNPKTNMNDLNMLWDYITLHEESMSIFLQLLSDTGIPDGYDNMEGHLIHTLQVYNNEGVVSGMKFHWYPCRETVTYLNTSEALRISVLEPDYLTRKLYNDIENGNCPCWKLKAQIFTEKQIRDIGSDLFDVTKRMSYKKYPLHDIGIIKLDRNPDNHFAEIEPLAFCPGNLVPCIMGSPDALFISRLLSYRDAHHARLGPNSNRIHVNNMCPMRQPKLTYNRDGAQPLGDNMKDAPNYYPNSFYGPVPYVDKNRPKMIPVVEKEPNNIAQSTEYYEELSNEERDRLADNLKLSISTIDPSLICKTLKCFAKIHSDLHKRVSKRLKVKC